MQSSYCKYIRFMNNRTPQANGLLLIDKPSGLSSANCLEYIKKRLNQRKIGHAGTLDPMATGLLIALLGKGTKLAPYITVGQKVYWGRLQLGYITDTYDKEGTVLEEHDWQHISPEVISSEMNSWIDLQEQSIPPYSAAKYQGKTFYSLKRNGKIVPQRTKSIHIDQVEVLRIELPLVSFRLKCSHGTYIRSLAHSLGMRLGCGAVLMDLIRERSEPFSLKSAFELERLTNEPELFLQRVIPLEESLPNWPKIRLNQEQVKKVSHGVRLKIRETVSSDTELRGSRAIFITPAGKAVALVEAEDQEGQGKTWKILRGL